MSNEPTQDLSQDTVGITIPRSLVQQMIDLLKRDYIEFQGLPHSLGYEFTHLQDIERTLSQVYLETRLTARVTTQGRAKTHEK